MAVGAGRESISGALPLFLFKEHWELAKRKIQPLLGFMCCLDPLGYTSSQFFTVPYLVLAKAFANDLEESTEGTQRVLAYILETCAGQISSNESFRS